MLVALLCGAMASPMHAQATSGDHLQVFLLTMGTGADIEERFGHNAIWIRDTVAHTDNIYNYGTFEFPRTLGGLIGFGARFAMGPPRYWLGVSDLQGTLFDYRMRQRKLTAQELNLTPAERADLASRLAVNALDANRYYAYDYFRDNCSTRVRDMLDLELGGALRRATVGKPAEGTLRFHTLRSITNDKLLFLAIDAAFGPRVDRPLDQWNEMFLPEKVQQRVRELTVAGADGHAEPLVRREFTMLDVSVYHVDAAPPKWGTALLAISLVIAGLIRLAGSRRRVAIVGRVVGGAWMLLTGVGGLILLFFWIFTAHVATWANWHLLLLSPLALLLVPSFWYRRGSHQWSLVPRIAMLLMVSVALGALLAFLPQVTRQDTTIVAELTALPTFVAALEALRGWNRRAGEAAE